MTKPTKTATKTAIKTDVATAPVSVVSAPVATPVAAPAVVAPVKVADDEVVLDDVMAKQSTDFLTKLQQIGAMISTLKTEYRVLEKKWSKELKIAQKLSSKRKRKAGNRAPSGFVKPTGISDELAKFLEKPVGSEMARTEVTRDINKYIRTNGLQDKENGRKIIPDTKLAALLKLSKTDELTYFNLQRYMSPHFSKNLKVAA
uniref:DM2 domain-containing protein n=1 Tax=viral metagenome TaxID=1070528 RepID=A0A6C0E528_9ZZZZ